MPKTLIIAEKPSVASDLARVLGKHLGKFKKDEASGSFSNDTLIITSAVGHLVEQKKPQTEDGKSLPWKMDYLPVMPKNMELEPIAKSADRLRKVLKLARSKDVSSLVNACDAGREGELIFRNIIRYGKIKKPLQRLWMQSMTDDAIMEAWASLKSDASMADLADAAVCRSESDWLVGLNSTRALTVLQSSAGGFNITPAGRVQTPTLALLAARQKEILAFKPETFYEVHASFGSGTARYEGRWFDPEWKKDDAFPQRTRERLWDAGQAAAIAERCHGRTGSVTEVRKPVSIPPPLLFDLTSLQKEASNRYGFSASRTLQLAQECYEKHKVLTYPRTDSKFLPQDYLRIATRTVEAIQGNVPELAPFASEILENKRIRPSKRVFDSSKVSDHFAIIPTGKFAHLSGDAARIFNLVLQRFLGVFMPPAEYEDTERTTIVNSPGAIDHFSTHGRVLLHPGWKAVSFGNTDRKKKEELCPVAPGEEVRTLQAEAEEAQTRPPSPYTEATLLTAMETAGKLVEDEDLAYAMKERGLGTPATRAAIIEGLLSQEYIARDGKELMATRRGMDLIDLLSKIGLSTLSSPELTGEWEYRLKQMESGKLDRGSFMKGIRAYTTEIVDAVRTYMKEGKNPDLQVACPSCGHVGLGSRVDAVSCHECKFRLRRVHAGLSLTDGQMAQLITQKELPVMEGFRSKFGKPFKAGLRLLPPETEKGSWKAAFHFDDANSADSLSTAQISLGSFDVKGQGELEVMETEKQWLIPAFVQEGSKKTGFSMSRIILGKTIGEEQLRQLLSEGKSELITGFISQRTHRPFDAYLVMDAKKGNVGFEFPPREPRQKGAAKDSASRKFTASDATVEDLSQAKRHGVLNIKGKGEHELLETDAAWHIDGLAYGKNRKPLVIPHTMCGINLTAEIVSSLLTKGKTGLIKDFTSHKSGRKFDAFLVFSPTTGRISYEFPPRNN